MNKRLIVTSVISIILISILFIGSTYSIFTTGEVDENQNVYTTGNLSVSMESNGVMIEDSIPISDIYANTLVPTRITVTNNGTVSYKFNLILTDTTSSSPISSEYIKTKVGMLNPVRLSDTTDNIIKSDIVVGAGESVDIDVRVWLSDDISNSEIGKSFYAKLTIDGLAIYDDSTIIDNKDLIAEYKLETAADRIINLYNDGSTINTVNIGNNTSNPQVSLNANQGIMLDNNGDYRYYGADPDNYVWYNDELWRIISVGNVKANANDTIGETRLKIIKSDILKGKVTGTSTDIVAFSYDSSVAGINSGYGVNDWSKSDLMTELNTLYFNSTSGTCYTGSSNTSKSCDFTDTGLSEEAKNLTADALYYLGGIGLFGTYANSYYTSERGTTVASPSQGLTSCTDGACPRATTWTGRVGLMYPSDYAYATDLSICTVAAGEGALNSNSYANAGCYDNDWLFYESTHNEWFITPCFYSYSSVSERLKSGAIYTTIPYPDNSVRPVQYLKSNVTIVGGEGTIGNPYQLSL